MESTDFTKKIYLVGGAVRDKLLGLPIKDRDYVAVGYTPNDFLHLPKVGKNFPVYLVDKHTQIALARKESKIAKGYNGFCYEIENISLYEDLKRRDLSINAMALDESSGEIIDPFKGKEDLENRILRHTSQAFCEDPLRVIRIARFRAKFGELWQIHPDTKALIATMKETLTELEPNRVYQEIAILLKYEKSYLFFQTLLDLGVLDRIFPFIYSLNTLKIGFDCIEISAFDYTMKVLESLKVEGELLKLSTLYYCLFLEFLANPSLSSKQREESFEKCLDIQIPKMLKKSMFLLMINYQKIKKIGFGKDLETLSFLESFKRNKELFRYQIRFFYAQERIFSLYSKESLQKLPIKKLWKIFYAICNYSPKNWIENSIPKPSGKKIQEHILQERLKIIEAFKKENVFLCEKSL